MKVLVRRLNSEKMYTWEDAEFVDGRLRTNGTNLAEVDIVSIMDDERTNYVRCSVCNQVLLNTSEEIEKHMKKYLDPKTCLTCGHLHQENHRNRTYEYSFQSDNTYIETIKTQVDLRCQYRSWYRGPYINSEEARRDCCFKRCADATMNPIEDIFTKHPGVFDDIITSDKIIEVGYKNREYWGGGYVSYQLRGRNQIFALVNDLNIVDRFVVRYRNDEWTLYYSKLTKELYKGNGGTYMVWNPREVNQNTIQYIKNKISELYV